MRNRWIGRTRGNSQRRPELNIAWIEPGIALSFWDGGVRLYMVDLRGLDGQPGESSERGGFVFFDPVARGYVWGVTKDGIVTQTRGR